MKKTIIFLSVILITSVASAEIVTLKNGRVIEGSIVEQTEDKIKLDTGIGVDITYYQDEIEKIEKGTPWVGQKKVVPASEDGAATIYLKFQESVQSGDIEEIKKYLSKHQLNQIQKSEDIENALMRLKNIAPKNIQIISEQINGNNAVLIAKGMVFGAESKGIIRLVQENQQWHVTEEDWKTAAQKEEDNTTDMKEDSGKGEIVGMVILPETDQTGDLFIQFVPKRQVFQGLESPRLFAVVPKEKIQSREIPFSIQNLPKGNYWGFATWDVADPFWEPTWGEGNCPGYAGDYSGGTKNVISVKAGEISKVKINCTRYLKPFNPDDYGTNYKILDLRYQRDLRDNSPQLIVTIKNIDEKPLKDINLTIMFNGKKEYYFVSGAGKILKPQEEKEYNIFSAYESFIFSVKKGFYETSSLYNLDIEIFTEDNDQRFKKHIRITDLNAEMNPKTLEIIFDK